MTDQQIAIEVIFTPGDNDLGAYERIKHLSSVNRPEFIRMVCSYALAIQPLMSLINLQEGEKTVVKTESRDALINALSDESEEAGEPIRTKVRVSRDVYPELYHDLNKSSTRRARLKNLFAIGIAIRDILDIAIKTPDHKEEEISSTPEKSKGGEKKKGKTGERGRKTREVVNKSTSEPTDRVPDEEDKKPSDKDAGIAPDEKMGNQEDDEGSHSERGSNKGSDEKAGGASHDKKKGITDGISM